MDQVQKLFRFANGNLLKLQSVGHILGGGFTRCVRHDKWFQICFIFTPTWGYDPIWRSYFSKGLVQPPTSILTWSMVELGKLFWGGDGNPTKSMHFSRVNSAGFCIFAFLVTDNYLKDWVVVSNMFYFHPHIGKLSNLTHIFQMDWNHQL